MCKAQLEILRFKSHMEGSPGISQPPPAAAGLQSESGFCFSPLRAKQVTLDIWGGLAYPTMSSAPKAASIQRSQLLAVKLGVNNL